VLGDRRGGKLGRALSAARRRFGRRPGRDELRRVRVEAEADLAAALFDERRQPIRKSRV
jgi:hypothetical protein